jgi:hypothetical protein
LSRKTSRDPWRRQLSNDKNSTGLHGKLLMIRTLVYRTGCFHFRQLHLFPTALLRPDASGIGDSGGQAGLHTIGKGLTAVRGPDLVAKFLTSPVLCGGL